jgi:hypothetical protein
MTIRLLGTLGSFWLGLFILSRFLALRKEYVIASQHFVDDTFALKLCEDINIKVNLGRNAKLCDRVRVAVNIPPFQTALTLVANETYLCGYWSCIELLNELTSTINGLILCIATAIGVPFLLYAFIYCHKRTPKRELPKYNPSEMYMKRVKND